MNKHTLYVGKVENLMLIYAEVKLLISCNLRFNAMDSVLNE